MTALLTPKPHIHPEYKSGEVRLADGWEREDGAHVQQVNASISEHTNGRLTLMLSKEDGPNGEWTALNLSADATEKLRRALNRAHRERSR